MASNPNQKTDSDKNIDKSSPNVNQPGNQSGAGGASKQSGSPDQAGSQRGGGQRQNVDVERQGGRDDQMRNDDR